MGVGGRSGRRARLYHQIRTAHLERAAQLAPATILYANRRYDFDAQLAEGLDLVAIRGLRAVGWLLRHPVEILEINEPLMWPAARASMAGLIGVSVARLRGGRRTTVVCYAIENLDPAHAIPQRWRARLRRRLNQLLSLIIWRRLDRIVYGTEAARQLYRDRLSARRLDDQLIWALPAPATDRPVAKSAEQVLFLGAFSERKGLPLLTEAWPLVLRRRPSARLTIIGKGPLQPVAEELAEMEGVRLTIDPARTEIRAALAESQILVLPSQPVRNWREQVGLPIVEGLSYGCTIVTTDETGLAEWLVDHDHRVIPGGGPAVALAEALLSALERPLDHIAVRASLPERDGRLAADDWLFR